MSDRNISTETEGTVEIHTVGALRAALDGLPDNWPIVSQVVAKDGKAWNVYSIFTARPKFLKWASLLQMTHEELETLPGETGTRIQP